MEVIGQEFVEKRIDEQTEHIRSICNDPALSLERQKELLQSATEVQNYWIAKRKPVPPPSVYINNSVMFTRKEVMFLIGCFGAVVILMLIFSM